MKEATAHPQLGPFMKRLLFDDIIPAAALPKVEALAFANQVLERFANPWLEHEYRVIATNQEEKFRIRVVPLIVGSFKGTDPTPAAALSLAAAAHLTFTQLPFEALGDAAQIPEFTAATKQWMTRLTRDGVEAALRCT